MDQPVDLSLAAIGVASLSGSLHCVAMCGPFAALAGHASAPGATTSALRRVAYHVGRLSAYASLGVLAGSLGGVLNLGAYAVSGLPEVMRVVLGGTFIVLGLRSLARIAPPGTLGLVTMGRRPRGGWLRSVEALASRFSRVASALGARAMRRARGDAASGGGLVGAGLLGASSALLPCGWLWTYVVLAAGSGSALRGATTMIVFFLGTVPALALVGFLSTRLGRGLAPQLRAVYGVVLLGLGCVTLATHPGFRSAPDVDPPPCHSHPTSP